MLESAVAKTLLFVISIKGYSFVKMFYHKDFIPVKLQDINTKHSSLWQQEPTQHWTGDCLVFEKVYSKNCFEEVHP